MVVHVWSIHDSQRMKDLTRYDDYPCCAKQLAIKLCALRRACGYTQEQVAYMSGISTYTYQKFEKGESKPGTPLNPRLSTLLALARTFNVDVRDLLSFD